MIPGEYKLSDKAIELNSGRETISLEVVNLGDRPVQVGSHFHFFEVNKRMFFDRELAIGMRLDIPAGTAVRFEPGEAKQVNLVAFAGKKKIIGFNNKVNGRDLEVDKAEILEKARYEKVVVNI